MGNIEKTCLRVLSSPCLLDSSVRERFHSLTFTSRQMTYPFCPSPGIFDIRNGELPRIVRVPRQYLERLQGEQTSTVANGKWYEIRKLIDFPYVTTYADPLLYRGLLFLDIYNGMVSKIPYHLVSSYHGIVSKIPCI